MTAGSSKQMWLHLEKDVHDPLLVLQSLLVVLKVFKRLQPRRESKAGLQHQHKDVKLKKQDGTRPLPGR